jgi:hypothetical protein
MKGHGKNGMPRWRYLNQAAKNVGYMSPARVFGNVPPFFIHYAKGPRIV